MPQQPLSREERLRKARQEPGVLAKSLQFTFAQKPQPQLDTLSIAGEAGLGVSAVGGAKDKISPSLKGLKSTTPEIKSAFKETFKTVNQSFDSIIKNVKQSENVLQGLGNTVDDVGSKFSDLGKSYKNLTVSGVSKFQETRSANLNNKTTNPSSFSDDAASNINTASGNVQELNQNLDKTESKLVKIGRNLNRIGEVADKAQWFALAVKSGQELLKLTEDIKRNFASLEDSKDIAKLSGVKGTEKVSSLDQQFGNPAKLAGAVGSSVLGGQELVKSAKQGVSVFNQFSKAKTRLNNVLGQNQNLETFISDIRGLVNGELKNAVTSTQSLNAAYEVLSSGFQEAGSATKVLEAGLKLSVASGAKADTVLRTLGKTINAYGLEAEDASKVAGILNRTVQQGITTIPELSNGFGQAATSAKEANVEIEKLAGSVSQLTSQGTSTPQAITGLKGLFQGISSGKFTERLKEKGVTDKNNNQVTLSKEDVEKKGFPQAIQDVRENTNEQQFTNVFRRRKNLSTVRQLTADGGESLKDKTSSIEGFSSKASEKITETATENLEKAFNFRINNDEILKFQRQVNKATEALLNLGKAAKPAFESGLDALSKMASSVETITSKFPGLIKGATTAALTLKGIGKSTKSLVETAAKLAIAASATRVLTGAIFKQVGALGSLSKGLRRYNVLAADVVRINGKVANSFQRIGLVASQLTGFSAAQDIGFSGGEQSKLSKNRSGVKRNQKISSQQLQETFFSSTGGRKNPSISQTPSSTTPVVADATGRRNFIQRINNNLTNRTFTGKWKNQAASAATGGAKRGARNQAFSTAAGVATGSSFGGGQKLKQGVVKQFNRLKSAGSGAFNILNKIRKGLGLLIKTAAPTTVAIGALVTSFKAIQGVAAFFNSPRKAAKNLKDDIKDLNKELEKIDKEKYKISIEEVGLNKKDKKGEKGFIDSTTSAVGRGLKAVTDTVAMPLNRLFNFEETGALGGERYRGQIEKEEKTREKIAETSLEARKDFIEKRKEITEAPSIEKTIEAQKENLPDLRQNVETLKQKKETLEERVKVQQKRVEESDIKVLKEFREGQLKDAKTKLSEVESRYKESKKELEQTEENEKLNLNFEERTNTATEDTKLSDSLNAVFNKRKKQLFENTKEVVEVGSEDRSQENLEKVDKNYRKAVENLNKQRQKGNITNDEFQNKIDELRNKTFETKGGEKVKVEDLITDPNLVDQTLKAIVNSVEKRIKEAQNFAKKNKIGIKFEREGELVNEIGAKQRKNQIDQNFTNEKLEALKEKKSELKDEGRLEENPQLRKNLNQKIENARTRQDVLNIQEQKLPLQRQQNSLNLQQQDISTSSNANSRQIRDLKQQELQVGIEGQKDYIKRLKDRRSQLKENDASDTRINTIQNRIDSAQNELERKETKQRQLQSQDERKTLNEKVETQLTTTRNVAESKKIPLENEERRNDLQQKVLEESSNTIGKAQNQVGTLEQLLSKLNIGSQRKEDLKEESREAKSELGDKRIEIQEKILSLEQKRLKIIQKQAEIQAKVKTQEAKAGLLKEEAEYKAVKNNPNATDAEKEAAAAELKAARTNYQGAIQNEKLVEQEGKVQQAIASAKQGKLELDKFVKGIKDQVQKALNTDVVSDDINVFKDSLSGFNKIAEKATNIVSNLTQQLAKISGIDKSSSTNSNLENVENKNQQQTSNVSRDNQQQTSTISRNEEEVRIDTQNKIKENNKNTNLPKKEDSKNNNLSNNQEKYLAEQIPNVSRKDVKKTDITNGSAIDLKTNKQEEKNKVQNKASATNTNSELWKEKNSENNDLSNSQEKHLAEQLPNVSRKEARRADIMNGSSLQVQRTKNPQSIYDSGQTKNITSGVPNLNEQDVKAHKNRNNKQRNKNDENDENKTSIDTDIPEIEISEEEKSEIRTKLRQKGNAKLQQSVDRVAKTKEQAKKFRENDKSFLDKSGKNDMFYNAKQERYKTINQNPNIMSQPTDEYTKNIKERNEKINATSKNKSEEQSSVKNLQKAVNSFDTSSMIKEIDKLRQKINQADAEKAKESAKKQTKTNESNLNQKDNNQNQKNNVTESKNVNIEGINVSVEVSTPPNEEGASEEIADKIEEVLNDRFSDIAQNLEQELGVN